VQARSPQEKKFDGLNKISRNNAIVIRAARKIKLTGEMPDVVRRMLDSL
jgi:hypothetical protein